MHKLDFLSPHILLFHNNNDRIKKGFGGLVSVILVLLVGLLIAAFGRDFFKRENPSLTKSTLNDGDYKFHEINTSLPIFYRLEHTDNKNNFWQNDRIVYFRPWYTVYKRENGSDWYMDLDDLLVQKKCTEDMFPSNTKFLEKIDISQYWCLEHSYDRFGGYWDYNEVGYYNNFLQACMEGKKNKKGEDCVSNEERLNTINKLTFIFFYPQIIVDPNDYDNGLKITYASTTVFPDNMLFKKYEIFLKYVEMNTDYGWILESKSHKSYLAFSHLSYDFETINEINPYNHQNTYIKFNHYVVKDREIFNRTYTKIQTLAAQVGGILKLFVTFFQGILILYSETGLIHSLKETLTQEKSESQIAVHKIKDLISETVKNNLSKISVERNENPIVNNPVERNPRLIENNNIINIIKFKKNEDNKNDGEHNQVNLNYHNLNLNSSQNAMLAFNTNPISNEENNSSLNTFWKNLVASTKTYFCFFDQHEKKTSKEIIRLYKSTLTAKNILEAVFLKEKLINLKS